MITQVCGRSHRIFPSSDTGMRSMRDLLLCLALGAAFGSTAGTPKDASDVMWAHAVNSREALERELAGPADFLEADVLMGHVLSRESSSPIPIMAHPPDTTSDMSLDEWLQRVVASDKGIKLDFKSLDAVEPTLKILENRVQQLNFPLWLNADVLPGPVDSTTAPIHVERFLALCHQYFPNATLSVGWTTHFDALLEVDRWHYEWWQVRQMVDVLSCNYGSGFPSVTFPVRGIYASRSIQQLKWLLGIIPESTLTVWSGVEDPLQVEDLLRIRHAFSKDKVFYDVPPKVNKTFQNKKNSIKMDAKSFAECDNKWLTITRGQGESCSSLTYLNRSTVVFGRSLPTAVIKNIVLTAAQNINITGFVEFFGLEESTMGVHELKIFLADVSSFAKTPSAASDFTTSDTDVLWAAVNDSVIYTFRHPYVRKESSCRFFKLDTTNERPFEAWTIPCDVATKTSPSFNEIKQKGIAEISSRKRLILPSKPFMFGMMSSGDEHVVVHSLKIETASSQSDSAFHSTPTQLTILLTAFIAVVICTFFSYFQIH